MSKQLTRDLKELIEAYFQEGKNNNRNRQTLSKKSGVSHNTITRILQEETIPAFETVLSLLQVVRPDDYLALLKKHFPNISPFDSNEAKIWDKNELIKLFESDEVTFLIFCKAGKSHGISRQFVAAKFGEFGSAKLKHLLDLNILKECDNTITWSKNVVLNVNILAKLVQKSVGVFCELDKGRTNSYGIDWYVEGLSEEGYKKLLKLQTCYAKDMAAIINKHPGQLDVTTLALTFCDGKEDTK